MGRKRLYRDNAHRQRAYRKRRKALLRRYPGLRKLDTIPKAATAGDIHIEHCSMQELLAGFRRELDIIITDPPYHRKSIPLYEELARLAARALKPSGVLCVFVPHAHLPEILSVMTLHIRYRWTLAYQYQTHGPRLFQRKIYSRWKPVVVFGPSSFWITDSVSSKAKDKSHDRWQQSESGLIALIEMLTQPGDIVVDPLCGTGSLAVAALRTKRCFLGCDSDPVAVQIARQRLYAELGFADI